MNNVQQSQLQTQRLTMLANALDPPADLNEAAFVRAVKTMARERGRLALKPTHYIMPAARNSSRELIETMRANYHVLEKTPPQYGSLFAARGPMHCEHLYAYYASRPRLKGVRYDAYNKMAREYRKAARDADYAATFWRPQS